MPKIKKNNKQKILKSRQRKTSKNMHTKKMPKSREKKKTENAKNQEKISKNR